MFQHLVSRCEYYYGYLTVQVTDGNEERVVLRRTVTFLVQALMGMGTTAIAWEAATAKTARERVIFMTESMWRGEKFF